MAHPFHDYLAAQLEKLLRDRRVVVFYDPRREFSPFVDDLEQAGIGLGGLPRVSLGDSEALLARYEGSFFALKSALEPTVELDAPEPLVVYLPGVTRDRHGSVLMELEKGGGCYEPQLRRLALNVLRKKYTDGDIDEMLASESLTYQDVVRFLGQDSGGAPSLVKLILGEGSSEILLCRWLTNTTHDAELEAKLATGELFKLATVRLGLALEAGTPLAKARHQTLRYVLLGEFRADLSCEPPPSLELVPLPRLKEEEERSREVARLLRKEHPDFYEETADHVENEFALANLGLSPACLGSVDTFRFEERLLLRHSAELIAQQAYDDALEVVSGRGHSYWVDRDVARLAQWEVCRLLGELGRELTRVRPLVKKLTGTARQWVEAYAETGGWFEVDRAQRALEAWVAKLDEEPEAPMEKALGLVRHAHESLLKEMAEGFTKALEAGAWTVPGALHQTRVFPEFVEAAGGRVAYFLVDALRYEMGADLVAQLGEAQDVRLLPAVAALPTITPVGMAALLPGASASFSVVDHKGKLASRIEDSVLPGLVERMKVLKAKRPEARDVDLGELLQKSTGALAKKLDDAPLIVVRSLAIDSLGEQDGGLLARQIMDTVVANVARAVRKLAKLGVEYFVLTADHGHQFCRRKEEDMTTDKPGGETLELHRRCWIGRGGQTPAGCVRVTGAELGYATDLEFVFPRGLAVFPAGGDLAYHHGGLSLQELVVPVVTLRMPKGSAEAAPSGKLVLEGYPAVLTNRTFGLRLYLPKDLFTLEPLSVRLVLLADGQEVGQAGMAPDADFDRRTGRVLVPPGKVIHVGMMLTRDEFKKVRLVALDPSTDAVLAQSDELTVRLGI